MRKLTAAVLTALCIGFFTGRYFSPEPAVSEAPAEPVREFHFADADAEPAPKAKSAEVLPDDLYIRLKNEAEKPVQKKTAQPAAKAAPRMTPEPPFTEDRASRAHREASAGIKALNGGNCVKASEYLAEAFAYKKDKNILSHYLVSLLLCGEAEKAAELAAENPLFTNGGTLADVLETAVKNGRSSEALTFFESLGISGNGRLMNAAGLAYETAGKKEQALLHYKEAYRLDSDNPFITFSRARTADMEGNYAEAVILYEKTAASAPTADLKRHAVTRSAEIREHLTGEALQNP
ncbi:hypothetical protein EP073_00035 [Geovibrio thiophilus]|uniref:Uncharacterized protein n=1 Tax=Geovibrio thiophilus TaxID=139438 RepID=A0A3R5YXH1_9BACT|nr:hypothetical protein [Geovibrio thiophilus]QAR31847.1 hypothetical protein EP073_00035 [Geovibrio thiophilus]